MISATLFGVILCYMCAGVVGFVATACRDERDQNRAIIVMIAFFLFGIVVACVGIH